MEHFNSDHFISDTVLALKKKFNIKIAVETGTYMGRTAKWLAENFDKVYTFEIMLALINEAKNYCKDNTNIEFVFGNSVDRLPRVINEIIESNQASFFFIDAHTVGLCPTPKELQIISKLKIKPVIAIHDFFNPNRPELGWDSYADFQYKWENIEKYVKMIYGDDFEYFYNSESEGANRGVVYITPKI